MTDAAHDEMFAALCREVGFCLHPKGEKRVLEACLLYTSDVPTICSV